MEFFNYPVSSYLLEKACRKRMPINGTFELTSGCNFNCKMCYVHSCNHSPIFESKEKWLTLFEEAQKKGLLYALVTGGEPLTHPQFQEIYSGLAKQSVITIMNTNCYLLDAEMMRFLKNKPPVRINATLYGTSDSTYKNLCGISNGFSVVDENIRRLKDNGFNVCLNMTFVQQNIYEMKTMLDYAKELSLEVRPTTYVFPTADGKNESRLSAVDSARKAVEIYRLTHSAEQFEALAQNNEKLIAEAEKTSPVAVTSGTKCRAGKCSYWVHADGKISFCGMTGLKNAPSVFEGGLESAWNFAVTEAEKVKGFSECASCRYRLVCRSCYAMAESENVTEESISESYMCEYHREYADYLLKEYEKDLQNKQYQYSFSL